MPGRAALLERGGRWHLLSDEWDHAVEGPLRWGADASALYFAAEDRGRKHLYRYVIESRTASVVAQGGSVQGFDVAGGVVASVADSLMHPARVHAVRDGQAPLRLESFNDKLLGTLRLGHCEEVEVKGALGEPVQMWVIYPPVSTRRRSGRCCTTSTAGRTAPGATTSTSAGTTTSSRRRATWSSA